MQIQLYLTAITQNLKRLVSRLYTLLWRLRDSILRLLSPPVSLFARVTPSDLDEEEVFQQLVLTSTP